jgi:catechol 2,3-dioxygenase-like lactoylglutathione lyase family enzyme
VLTTSPWQRRAAILAHELGPSSRRSPFAATLYGLARDEEVVPVLYVEDAARAVAWYGRLGFVKEWEHQFEPGFPWFVSVARGNARLYLSEHKGDARPDTLIHLYVKDIDAVFEEFGIPVDEQGLAGRECDFVDPDGNRLRVATRRS